MLRSMTVAVGFWIAIEGMFVARASAEESRPTRVLSCNIRYGTARDGENHWEKRKDWLAETIATYDPDLLGTQETLVFQRDYLAKKLPGHEAFGVGRDDGKDKGETAALFFRASRYEKLEGGHFWLSPDPGKVGGLGWDAAITRMASWVKLKDRADPGGPAVLFLNTHFDHVGKTARLESAKLIARKLGELGKGCRLVVTGDFNAGEGTGPYQALFGASAAGLRDAFRTMHPVRKPAEGTFSGFKADAVTGERIDWIGCSADWEVRLAGIDRTAKQGRTPSDHFAVTATLRPASTHIRVRALCYNIHHGRGMDGKVDLPRIAKVIRDLDPDFVALQEVDDRTRRTGGVDQTAELARLTGLIGRFGKQIVFEGGGYGQAILSRVPVDRGAVHLLPGEPDREQRIAFAVKGRIHGRETTFISTHLHHIKEEFRTRQVARINELFGGGPAPTILMGDLNAEPPSPPLKTAKEKWTVAEPAGQPLTYPADKPVKRIDYGLYLPAAAFQVVELRVIDEPVASDHRPVLIVLEPAKE
jgi:endonuclease/exonuclease/phosphatase family metal-dependent hydrolase